MEDNLVVFCFFNDTATTEIYTLSLHDALPISCPVRTAGCSPPSAPPRWWTVNRSTSAWSATSSRSTRPPSGRSEEHTSELQSRQYLVCRLLLEKKKKQQSTNDTMDSPPST